jgi:hypothetical protein
LHLGVVAHDGLRQNAPRCWRRPAPRRAHSSALAPPRRARLVLRRAPAERRRSDGARQSPSLQSLSCYFAAVPSGVVACW